MTLQLLIQYLFSAITVGSIYAIVAIGFNIIYNATGIVNFAQGEFVMLGAMIAHSLAPFMPLAIAILIAVVATAAIGAGVEWLIIRRLAGPSVLRMIIITVGLSIIIREAALHIWDEKVRALPFFTGNEISSVQVFGAYVSPQVFWVLGITTLVVVALQLFFKYSLAGQAMRACSSNSRAARLCGISTRNMTTLAFVLSAAIGALGGCIVSPLTQTTYSMGTGLAIKGFTVAILGGMGNSMGAVVGGLVLGLLETFSIIVLPSAYKDALSIAILLGILFFRPSGLFGNAQAVALREY